MHEAVAGLGEFKKSLPALAARTAEAAVRKQPLPWSREVGQSVRRALSKQVDEILAVDYQVEPIQEFRDIADVALMARCDDLFHAWTFGQPLAAEMTGALGVARSTV